MFKSTDNTLPCHGQLANASRETKAGFFKVCYVRAMKWLQRTALWLLLGALLGSFVVLLLYPYVLSYKPPPVLAADMCKCSECVEMTGLLLMKAQLLGAGIGALVTALAGEGWLWQRRRKADSKKEMENTPPA